MWELITVLTVVAVAAYFITNRFWRAANQKGTSCGCGGSCACQTAGQDCQTCGQPDYGGGKAHGLSGRPKAARPSGPGGDNTI